LLGKVWGGKTPGHTIIEKIMLVIIPGGGYYFVKKGVGGKNHLKYGHVGIPFYEHEFVQGWRKRPVSKYDTGGGCRHGDLREPTRCIKNAQRDTHKGTQ